jgi:hypothetical protein
VFDGSRLVVGRSQMIRTNPFNAECARIRRTLDAVQATLPRLVDKAGIEDRACLVATRVNTLRARCHAAPMSEAVWAERRQSLRELMDEAVAVRNRAAGAALAAGRGGTVMLCAANPWAPFGHLDELAEGRTGSGDLSVLAFGGEKETAALNVFNMSSRPRTFRVEVAPLSQAGRSLRANDIVMLFEVIDVPTERSDLVADALNPLGSANLLQVPAWGARQLWLNVDARALTAGEWKGSIRLRSLDVEPVEVVAPLTVTVSRFNLPAKQALHQCGWGYVESSMLKDYPAEAIADQVEHGTNVYVATFFPKARFDANGYLVGEIDFTEHDDYVKKHAAHGTILFCGYQGALQCPAPEGSPAFNRAHVQWLRAWVKHLADLGVGYDGFALYPIDEPDLVKGRIDAYLLMAKLAREADPRIRMYTDPYGFITEDELRSMLPYVDIWCPNRSGLVLDKKNEAKLATIKGSGKAVWMYECDDNAKHQSPLGYYRGSAWLAWRHGMTGIGFWSYCTSPDDPWFVPGPRQEFLLVYPGNGVVSSKRWEAVRDGIEDYGMLAELRRRLERVGASARPEDVEAARRLLGERATEISRFCIREHDTERPGPGVARSQRRIEDQRWNAIQKARRELIRCLERL